jgi:hypothetical protein
MVCPPVAVVAMPELTAWLPDWMAVLYACAIWPG